MTECSRMRLRCTIAALFVIGGALERSGAVITSAKVLRDRLSGNTRWAILAFSCVTAFFSAWMNNTAIVAILLPVTLGFARSKDIAASRLLMPLSYASILELLHLDRYLHQSAGQWSAAGSQGAADVDVRVGAAGIPLAVAGIGYLTFSGRG